MVSGVIVEDWEHATKYSVRKWDKGSSICVGSFPDKWRDVKVFLRISLYSSESLSIGRISAFAGAGADSYKVVNVWCDACGTKHSEVVGSSASKSGLILIVVALCVVAMPLNVSSCEEQLV